MESKNKFSGKFALIALVLIVTLAAVISHVINMQTENQILKKYVVFKSENQALNFSFRYPPDWRPMESQGRTEKYDAVQVMGPRDEKLEFGISFSITAKPTSGKSASDLLSEYLSRTSRFSGFKVIKNKSSSVAGQKTSIVDYSYAVMLPLGKANPKPVLVKGEALYLIDKDKSFRITFFGTAEQFNQNIPVFRRALKTFKFSN